MSAVPGTFGSLRSIGSAAASIGKSGLLGPYTPRQLRRVVTGMPLTAPTLGSVYRLDAALDPGRAAVIDDAGVVTFRQMDTATAAVAAGLARLGVKEGDTVALLCRNHRGFVQAVVAAARLGADVVYLNTGFAGPQLARVVADERVGALVADEEYLPRLDGADLSLPVVIGWTDPAAGHDRPTLAGLVEAGAGGGPTSSWHQSRHVLLTSGTTGRPKGAAHNLRAVELLPVLGLLSRIPYRRGDVTVMAAPMFHAWGLANTAVALGFGATMVLPRRFDPEATLELVSRYRARVLVAVPVMIQRILELPDDVRRRHDTSSLRVVALSGSALPGGLATRALHEWGDVVYSLYGSTEAGWVSVAGPHDLRADPGTAGRILPGIAVRLADPDGHDVGHGETGRILVRSALTFEGYTSGDTGGKDAGAGWTDTGDLGHFDGSGRLVVDGRADDMIVSGGENVYPAEVEAVILTHPGVVEAVVAGVVDSEFGRRLEAWVVRRHGHRVTADEVKGLVRAELARFKVPRRVHFVDELPRNSTGKVLRKDLAPGPSARSRA